MRIFLDRAQSRQHTYPDSAQTSRCFPIAHKQIGAVLRKNTQLYITHDISIALGLDSTQTDITYLESRHFDSTHSDIAHPDRDEQSVHVTVHIGCCDSMLRTIAVCAIWRRPRFLLYYIHCSCTSHFTLSGKKSVSLPIVHTILHTTMCAIGI